MDAVPFVQNSEMSILDVLNDDCIGEILHQLKTFDDLLNVVNTCKRFREIAKRHKILFKSIAIVEAPSFSFPWLESIETPTVSVNRVPILLNNFGHLIESISLNLLNCQQSIRNRGNEIFQLIAKCCGSTLKSLILEKYNPNFNKQNRFPVLENLILDDATPIQFCLNSPLKYLYILKFNRQQNDFDSYFIQPFPYLEMVMFNTINHLTDDKLSTFLSLNPQLRKLHIKCCTNLTSTALEIIGYYSQNIEKIYIFHSFQLVTNESSHYLNGLQKMCGFGYTHQISVESLLNFFVENNCPIEELDVFPNFTAITPNFPTLMSLKVLTCFCISYKYFMRLIKRQTALQTLRITYGIPIDLFQTIKKILQISKNLTELEINLLLDSKLNLNIYNRILNLVKDRVKVIILYWRRKKDIPENVLKANEKWLVIRSVYLYL